MQRFKNRIASLRLRALGYFRYFGVKVFSPQKSILVDRVRHEGVYERVVCDRMQHLARPNTWLFDVGANLGLMSVPILASNPTVHAVSIEPSPNSFPFLSRTREFAPFRNRWHVLSRAVSSTKGTTDFVLSASSNSAFEGMRNTQRVSMEKTITVESSPLDEIWMEFGKPDVSLVKIDVEGAETLVLQGAERLIDQCRPAFIVEWSLENLDAYAVPLEWLLNFASERQYLIFDSHHLTPVSSIEHLRLLCQLRLENFLLLPKDRTPLPT